MPGRELEGAIFYRVIQEGFTDKMLRSSKQENHVDDGGKSIPREGNSKCKDSEQVGMKTEVVCFFKHRCPTSVHRKLIYNLM